MRKLEYAAARTIYLNVTELMLSIEEKTQKIHTPVGKTKINKNKFKSNKNQNKNQNKMSALHQLSTTITARRPCKRNQFALVLVRVSSNK